MSDTATRVVRRRPMAAFTLDPQTIAALARHCSETGEPRGKVIDRALHDFLRKYQDTPEGVEN